MTFVDSHAHLDDEQFDNDRENVISRLSDNDISLVINIGSDLKSSIFSKQLAQDNDNIYFAAGIHPHDSDTCTEEILEKIEKLLCQPKCVALGEIGLDYFKNYSPADIQREIFDRQLSIAQKNDMPICVHMREATKDTVDFLKKYSPFNKSGVIHSFSGSRETAKIMLDMGFYLSISGPVTYANAVNLRDVVSYIPTDKLLIETDCPYLTPVPNRGVRNEPKYVRHTAMKIAEIKQMTLEDVAQITSDNALRLFKIKF
jgi:TatD DNase family protein